MERRSSDRKLPGRREFLRSAGTLAAGFSLAGGERLAMALEAGAEAKGAEKAATLCRFQPATFRPRRLVSWWSRMTDLQWPDPRVRDAIRRHADRIAAADVDTVVQFGFHCRFDFAPSFGLLHGYLNDVAESLHQRGIRFIEHYSCNVIARPRSAEDLKKYHTLHRHHVPIHPDPAAAETLRYAGFLLNDLREVDVETGAPTYSDAYQTEMFCHTNPDFLAMHEAYLRRHLAEDSGGWFSSGRHVPVYLVSRLRLPSLPRAFCPRIRAYLAAALGEAVLGRHVESADRLGQLRQPGLPRLGADALPHSRRPPRHDTSRDWSGTRSDDVLRVQRADEAEFHGVVLRALHCVLRLGDA